MNCKPGDLAMYVGPVQQSRGRVVLVVAPSPYVLSEWVIDPPLAYVAGYSNIYAKDSSLRPIRPTDGEDETLQWAGKPNEVTA